MCGELSAWPVLNCHCLKCVSVINAIGASHQHILSDLCVKTTAHCVKRRGGGRAESFMKIRDFKAESGIPGVGSKSGRIPGKTGRLAGLLHV